MEMTWIVINYIVSLVDVLIICKFMGSLLIKKYPGIKNGFLILLMSTFSFTLSSLFNDSIWKFILYVGTFLFINYLFEGSLKRKIIGWLILLIAMIAIDNLIALLLMVLLNQPLIVFVQDTIFRLGGIILSKITLYFFAQWIANKKNHGLIEVKVKPSFVTLVILFFINIIILMLLVLTLYNKYNIQDDIMKILVLSFGIICILAIAIYDNIQRQSKEQMNIQLFHQQEDLHKKYLIAIESATDEMKRIKHDFSNHMMCVLGYLEMKHYDKLEKYINKLCSPLESSHDIIVAGHPVISSMIYSKMLCAKKEDVIIKVESNFEEVVNVEDIDLCILIGNILDNAIEACLNITEDEKVIYICIQTKKEWFLLDCKNPINKQLLVKEGNSFKTSKKDKEMHGMGLQNIQSIVNKYGGDISIDQNEQHFEVRVSINNTNM